MHGDEMNIDRQIEAIKETVRAKSRSTLPAQRLAQSVELCLDAWPALFHAPTTPVQLQTLFSSRVYFRTPFSEGHGLSALSHHFSRLRTLYPEAQLGIHQHAHAEQTLFFEWRLGSAQANVPVQNGMTKLMLDETGKIRVMLEFWENAPQCARLPIIGPWLQRWLDKRRAKSNHIR